MDGSGLKPSEAVFLALRELDEQQGASAKSIQYYLMGKFGIASQEAGLLVSLGLKRGIVDGTLVRCKGRYMVRPNDDIGGRLRSGLLFRNVVSNVGRRNRRQRAAK